MNSPKISLFELLEKQIVKLLESFHKPHIIVGLSGGPDSVFLLYFLKYLAQKNLLIVSAAHLNHEWRPQASDEALFCKQLCESLNIPFFLGYAHEFESAVKQTGSKEDLGRRLRATFFDQLQVRENAHLIALAHHADDQRETFFVRIARGTTLHGLTCMQEINKNIIRPLLNINKQQILNYLHENQMRYVQDITNFDNSNLRSRIRNHLFPALNKTDSRIMENIITVIGHLQEENELLDTYVKNTYATIFENNLGKIAEFQRLVPAMQRRIIIMHLALQSKKVQPSSGFFNEIIRFLASKNKNSHQLTKSLVIHKTNKNFWIE